MIFEVRGRSHTIGFYTLNRPCSLLPAGLFYFYMKTCDICGKEFTDKPIPVFDENWKKQKGIVSCGCHCVVPFKTYISYIKSGYSHLDVQQNANLINNQD